MNNSWSMILSRIPRNNIFSYFWSSLLQSSPNREGSRDESIAARLARGRLLSVYLGALSLRNCDKCDTQDTDVRRTSSYIAGPPRLGRVRLVGLDELAMRKSNTEIIISLYNESFPATTWFSRQGDPLSITNTDGTCTTIGYGYATTHTSTIA